MNRIFAVVAFFFVIVSGVAWAEPPAASRPATAPDPVAKAVYTREVELVELLMQPDLKTDDLLRVGTYCRMTKQYPRAAALHLMALREKPKDTNIEYQLANDFAMWGQSKLAMQYLNKTVEDGYWIYPELRDDKEFDSIRNMPDFAAVLAKVKAAYAIEAPKYAPGITVKMPVGTPPAAGWPVVIFLHGWGSNRKNIEPVAEMAAAMGYVGIALDGTTVIGPEMFDWGMDSADQTHVRIQAALNEQKFKIDTKRVVVQGFSQGGMHAARLLAEHPESYAGAICNSPGPLSLVPKKLANATKTGPIVLSIGDAEAPDNKKGVELISGLWKENDRTMDVIHFKGGHSIPPNIEEILKSALEKMVPAK